MSDRVLLAVLVANHFNEILDQNYRSGFSKRL
jgi:hypothetical protein